MLYVTPDSYKILTHCRNNFELSISIVKKTIIPKERKNAVIVIKIEKDYRFTIYKC